MLKYGRYLIEAGIAICLFLLPFFRADAKVEFAVVEKEMTTFIDGDTMKKEDHQYLRRFYSLNEENYDQVISYGPSSSMGVDEILIVQQEDSAARKQIKKAMEKRVEEEIKIFEGYGKAQTALLKAAVIVEKGSYVALFVNPEAAEQLQAFEALF